MSDIASKVIEYKKNISDLKKEQSELEGERKGLMKRLKEEFGCDSIEEAQKKFNTLNKEIDESEFKMKVLVSDFEKAYPDVI